tara:strand:+ start:532 stop:1098 length:567 start_codon:yes stop_codon:yes gene_type:complete
MRVIRGSLKGRKIEIPIDRYTRPLRDMVRESIFNIIEHSEGIKINLKNAKVLDLFSGTGSFGIECLSRGASEVFFFENYNISLKILRKNLSKLSLEKKTKVFEKNIYEIDDNLFDNKKFDIIFLDPPFNDDKVVLLINKIKKLDIISNNTLIIIHRNKKTEDNIPSFFRIERKEVYGLSKIIFGKLFF